MPYLLVRQTVKDFDRWLNVFEDNLEAAADAGLVDCQLWRDADDPDTVVCFFRVEDLESARAFTEAPEAYQAAHESGIVGEPLALWLEEI